MNSTLVSATMLLVISATFFPAHAQQPKPTARAIVEEIKKKVGVEWKPDTVDTFKAGNPDTSVTGVAVTMMATLDVLERASERGLNFVITHEPTFYAHLDTPEGMPESDPVWAEKRAFIEKHNMVVWRFHDHWHMRHPDTASKPVSCTRCNGRNFRHPKTNTCSFFRKPH